MGFPSPVVIEGIYEKSEQNPFQLCSQFFLNTAASFVRDKPGIRHLTKIGTGLFLFRGVWCWLL